MHKLSSGIKMYHVQPFQGVLGFKEIAVRLSHTCQVFALQYCPKPFYCSKTRGGMATLQMEDDIKVFVFSLFIPDISALKEIFGEICKYLLQ